MRIFIETFLVLSLILSVKSQGFQNVTGHQRCYLRDQTVGICVFLSECASVMINRLQGIRPRYCGYAGPSKPLVCCESNNIKARISNGIAEKGYQRCYLRDRTVGICTRESECASVKSDLQKGIRPLYCGYEGPSNPIVCCKQNKIEARIAEKKCQEYSSRTNSENRKNVPLIIDGENAMSAEYPHMAALGYGQSENIEFRCGGSLISEQFVLTAAHCLESQDKPVSLVRLGDLGLVSKTEPEDPQNFKVNMTYTPPEYNSAFAYHDIGLIKLESPVNFTKYVQPACLETESESKYNNLTITGWGAFAYGARSNGHLQKASVFKLPTMDCTKNYRVTDKLPIGFDEESQICAGNFVTHADTCQGDSGGPLQAEIRDSPKMYKIVGVTSLGIYCGLTPGVYTKVSKYIDWIESIVWSN